MKLNSLVDGDILTYKSCFGIKGDFIQKVEATDNFLYWIEDMFETKPKVFLTGPTNFRKKIASIKPYKGNRTATKPPHFKEVREYLVDWWKAIVSQDAEADDYIASSSSLETVIVSTDKDFKTVGNTYLFNPTKNELMFITEYEAWFNFYVQMLVGDSADNVPGIDKIGAVKAPKLLMDKDVKEMENTVRDLYRKQYGDKGDEAFEEVGQLLWLRRDIKL